MTMFMVIGGIEPDFDFGPLDTEVWVLYVNGRNPRNAVEVAMDEADFNPDSEQKQLFIVHPMGGKASEYRFKWEPKIEGRLTAV